MYAAAPGHEVDVANVEDEVPNARIVHEAHGRIEVLLDLFDTEAAAPALVVRRAQAQPPGGIVTNHSGRLRLHVPGVPFKRRATGQPGIEIAEVGTEYRIVTVGCRVAVSDDKADIGFCQHVGGDAAHHQGAGIEGTISALLNGEGANIPASYATTDTTAILDIDRNATGTKADFPREVRACVLY